MLPAVIFRTVGGYSLQAGGAEAPLVIAKSLLGNRTKECGEQLVELRDEVGERRKGRVWPE